MLCTAATTLRHQTSDTHYEPNEPKYVHAFNSEQQPRTKHETSKLLNTCKRLRCYELGTLLLI